MGEGRGVEGREKVRRVTLLFLPDSAYRKCPQGRAARKTSSSLELLRKDTICSSHEVISCPHQHMLPRQ